MIKDKKQMYALLKAGAFGNRFRIWDTEQEFRDAVEAGFDWLVGVRCVGRPGMPYYHHKTYDEAVHIARALRSHYGCATRFYEASPDHLISIQGEFVEDDSGPMLEWSTARTHMRAALELERNLLYGPGARLVMRRMLSEGSYQDLLELGELYPGAVVEFTAYESFVGGIPGRNMVVWEVRHY